VRVADESARCKADSGQVEAGGDELVVKRQADAMPAGGGW